MPRKQLPEITLAQAFEEFLTEVRGWGRAEKTIAEKRRSLDALARACPRGHHTLTRNLHRHVFRDALLDLHQGLSDAANDVRRRSGRPPRTGRSPGAMLMDRATLRQFVAFLDHREWVRVGFNADYEIKHTARGGAPAKMRSTAIHRRIPEDLWGQLISCAPHPRERLLITCGLYWARRGSDLSYMTWKDLHLDEVSPEHPHGWVELWNPKKRRRVNRFPMPVGTPVRREIDRYLAWFVPRYGQPQPDWPLFAAKVQGAKQPAGQRGRGNWPLVPDKSIGNRGAGTTVKTVLHAFFGAGVDLSGEGGHTLRRSGAAAMEERGGLAAAQLLLDHEHAAQAAAYTGHVIARASLAKAILGEPVAPSPEPEPPRVDNPALGVVIDMFSRQRVA